jgi:hypothetical protein
MKYLKECIMYLKEGVLKVVRRKVLKELLINILLNVRGSGYRKISIFGCKVCMVSLYKDSTCFARYYNIE